MRTIFHITTQNTWNKAKQIGSYDTASLHTEGFIHCSRPHQVLEVANIFFKDSLSDLILLHINEELVTAPVKYEGDADDKFPHIYGALNLNSVIGTYEFSQDKQEFSLPRDFELVCDTLVRLSQPGDEAEIASTHTHAWQQAYQGIVPDSFLAARPLSFRSRLLWFKSGVEGKTPATFFVAESARHGIIGFCAVKPARDEEFKGFGEITAIYCLNAYKGKGIGAALFRIGQQQLGKMGFQSSYLWVLRDNPTISFYEKMGGVRLDKEKIIDLEKPLIEVAYEWKKI